MILHDPCWRGITLNEQFLIQYKLPGKLSDRMTVTQFLKGRVTREAGGCPQKASSELFGEDNNCNLVAPLQVHRTACIDGNTVWSLPSRPEADAVFIKNRGVYGSLRFADCIPVVLVSENPFDWCLLIHSGFKGTCKKITEKVLKKIVKHFGSGWQDLLHAWVGPGIGECCYSRRTDDPLTHWGIRNLPSDCVICNGNDVFFDLPKAIITSLYDIRISPSRIHRIEICTSCSPGLCHSYRRGDLKNRSILLARIFTNRHNSIHWWENKSDGTYKYEPSREES